VERGEAAGALAAHCLQTRRAPRGVYETEEHLRAFQRLLTDALGFELEWPESIRVAEARI
jgi:hypothetical protein